MQPTADIRRSPRFLKSTRILRNNSNENEQGHRVLRFHDSVEPMIVPSSVDVRVESASHPNTATDSSTNVCNSPLVRRSPRFQRASQAFRAPSSEIPSPEIGNNQTASPRERRTLQFHESVEPVSVPTSVDVREDVGLTEGSFRTGSNVNSSPSREIRGLQYSDNAHPISVPSSVDLCVQSSVASDPVRNNIIAPDSVTPQSRNQNTSRDVVNTDLGANAPNSGQGCDGEDGAFVDDSEDEVGEKLRISEADEMSRLYSFFSTRAVKKIRCILKSWDLRQIGKKTTLIAKCMLHIRISTSSGMSLREVLTSSEESSRYDAWLRLKLKNNEVYPIIIPRAPNEEHFLKLLPDAEASEFRKLRICAQRARSEQRIAGGQPPTIGTEDGQEVEIRNGAPESTQFGINEFARLLITIRDDEDARAAVISMGQELSRAQLDAGVTRGDFWTIVEQRFNDASQNRFLNMAGAVDGVDSSLPPLVHRTATFLKDKFNDSKADFTQYLQRWSASGQNDPDRFKNFLPKLGNNDLSALGKRMMVMFVCIRKGTPYEEEHFTNVCCKLIPGGVGRDEGSRFGSANGDEGSTEQQQKKRKAQPEAEGIKDLASSVSKIAACYEGRKTADGPLDSSKEVENYSNRYKKIRILENVVKKMSEHPDRQACDEVGITKDTLLALRKLHQDMRKDLLSDEDQF